MPLNKNLKIGYFLAFANELYLPIAVWLLFFLQYLSFTQVAVIGALTTVSANIFEIPTGAIADLIGRKWTLFLSFILSAIGLLVISSGNSFLVFAIGRIINGLGSSFYSGTHESLMYDTLKSLGKENRYDYIVAKVEMFAWIGLFISAIAGGFLYDYWRIGPFVVTAIIYFLSAIFCLFLDEPTIDSELFNFKNYVKQNLQGFSELFSDNKSAIISLLMITVASGYFFAAKILGISQAEQYGLSATAIGILFGSGYLVSALASYFYPLLKKRFGNAKLLIGATLVLIVSFIFAPFVGVFFGGALIICRISSSTTFNNAKSMIINRMIKSKNRSTALSTLALLSQLPFTLTFYFVGQYIDMKSPNSFALLLGIILSFFLLIEAFFVRKYLFAKESK